MKKLWLHTISVFNSLFICQKLFEKSSFVLNNFSDRTIGTAVLNGIDIANRSLFYYKLIFLFCSLYFISFYIFNKIWNKSDDNSHGEMLFTTSTLSIFILVFHYINGSPVFVNIFNILNLILVLLLAISIGELITKRWDKVTTKILASYDLTILSFLYPLAIFFIRWGIIEGSFIFTKQFYFYYVLIWVAYWLTVRILHKFKTSILTSSITLILIPITISMSNEVQYALSKYIYIDQRIFTIVSICLLALIGIVLFIRNRHSRSSFRYAKNAYLPIFIATITFFQIHTNFLEINTLDMFHHGENLISTQQLFMFGKIPFINLYPTHGISYMLGQVAYSFLNGYQAFAPWLWEWIPKTIEVVLLYLILAKISNSYFATLSIAFLPIIGVFGGSQFVYGYTKLFPTTYYFTAFLSGLIMIRSLKKPDLGNFIKLWLGCLLLTIWRVDFGIGSLISCMIILTIVTRRYKDIAKSLLIVGLISIIVFGVFTKIGYVSFHMTLAQIFEFVKFQGQAQGLPQIISAYSPIAIFQYFLLPSIGVFYFIYFAINHKTMPRYKILLVYLAIFSIIISIRSLQRQTLAVLGYNPYFFVFLLLSLPIYLSKQKNNLSHLYFIIGLFTYQLVLPNNIVLIKSDQQVALQNWHSHENRVHINDEQFKVITSFLNSNLTGNQTFLDLTSSPTLYVTTGKKFLNYFIPTAYLTSDLIQDQALERITKEFSQGNVPIILFKQKIPEANNLDGVPNEIRSYKIYEFVYKNYHPIGLVDDYQVWSENGKRLLDETFIKKETTIQQEFNLQNLPYIWAEFDKKNAIRNPEVTKLTLFPVDVGEKPITIKVIPDIDKSMGNYLRFTVISNSGGKLIIDYGKNSKSQFVFNLIQSAKSLEYLVRLSTQYEWMTSYINKIEISASKPVSITAVDILRGD